MISRGRSLISSEYKLHGARYYTVRPVLYSWIEMEEWARSKYGEPSTIWEPECGRWYMNNSKFWFRNESDLTMFLLKWA